MNAMQGGRYRSAYERLMALPPVFHINELGETYNYARNSINRWRQRGVIVPIGHRSGVYFNLVADPQAPEKYREEGALRALAAGRRPLRPFITGNAALYEAGLSDRPVTLIDVVLAGESIGERLTKEDIGDLSFHLRPAVWEEWVMEEADGSRPMKSYGISRSPVLPPEMVYADQMVYGDYLLSRPMPEGLHEKVAHLAESLQKKTGMQRADENAHVSGIDIPTF